MLAASVIGCVLYIIFVWNWATGASLLRSGQREVLVLYVFAHTDNEFLENLRFFVREAIEQDVGVCDYVIAVQRSRGLQVGQSSQFL